MVGSIWWNGGQWRFYGGRWMVLWWMVDGFMVDGGWFYGGRQTRQLKNKQKTRKKVEKATRDDKKAADSVLKQELHSHHQNGDMPRCPIAEAWQM
jgi:hypothetical protein